MVMPIESTATVVIVTRNRLDDACRAVASALAQRPTPPVIVVDDASEDGTGGAMRARFPTVTVLRTARPLGAAGARNLGVERAATPIAVLIDDDAYFTNPRTVAHTVRDFDHPRVGAVAVPLLEGGRLLQSAPSRDEPFAADYFIGAAHALRRDVFCRLGGYRESMVIYVEEPDLCLRMLAAGYVTLMGTAAPVVHEPHPARNVRRRLSQRWRNEMLFKWYHTPTRSLPIVLAGHTAQIVHQSLRRGRWGALPGGLGRGMKGILTGLGDRRPVGAEVYRLWRDLRRMRCMPLRQVLDRLPAAAWTEVAECAADLEPELFEAIDPA